MSAEDVRKRLLREGAKARRAAMGPAARAAASLEICRRLASDPRVSANLSQGRTVAAYLAAANEVDLSQFISVALAAGARVVVPRRDGAAYSLAELRSLDACGLESGPMGILQPKAADGEWRVGSGEVDVWLVPGLLFDGAGGRIGYGGGWYDRLLAGARADAAKIGIVFAANFLAGAALPVEGHDIRMTGVATEGGGGF